MVVCIGVHITMIIMRRTEF